MKKTITLPIDQVVAIRTFAENHGHNWKRALSTAFMNGTDANEPMGDALRRFRNRGGPSMLSKLPFSAAALAPTFLTLTNGMAQSDGWTLAKAARLLGIDPQGLLDRSADGSVVESEDGSWAFAIDRPATKAA